MNFKIENDGFVVKGNDVAIFLEEKLAILGLTERESEEFYINANVGNGGREIWIKSIIKRDI